VIARSQHLGDRAALPFGGAGILRVFQQPGRVAFFFRRSRVAQHAGQKAHGGVDHGLGGNLAPGHDEIPERDFLNAVFFEHPFIHAFEPTAKQRHAARLRPIAGHRLGERHTARAKVHQRPTPPRCCHRLLYRRADHIGAQHHARAAARGRVVHIAVLGQPVFAQVMGMELPFPFLQRAPRQAFAQHAGKGTGKQRNDPRLPHADQIGGLIHQ